MLNLKMKGNEIKYFFKVRIVVQPLITLICHKETNLRQLYLIYILLGHLEEKVKTMRQIDVNKHFMICI